MQPRLAPSPEGGAARGGESQVLALESQPDTLSDVVYETIRSAIVNKRLPPGSRVTEAALARQLDVSKTPVREALLKLRQIGLIEPAGRRGGRIVLPSKDSIRQAYETREALEAFAAERASERATFEERDRILAYAKWCLEAAETADLVRYRQWDTEFHHAVAGAAANPRLAELIDNAFALVMTLRSRDVPFADASIECGRAHVAIAEAIAEGNAAEAGLRMRTHVRQVAAYVVEEAMVEAARDQSA